MEITEKMRRWSETYTLSSFDVGVGETLRISKLLFMLQETAQRHLEEFDIGYDRLCEEGMVFLLAKTWLKINRLPHMGETIEVRTWPSGLKGVQFYRSFAVYVGEECCAECIQCTFIASPETHKIMHPRAFVELGFDPACGEPVAMYLKRLHMEEQPLLGKQTIRYSDLDYNGHLSNAIYADFITDFMPGGMRARTIKELQINYIAEAKEGDEISLYGGLDENGVFSLYGEHSRGRCFDISVQTA